MQLFIQQLFTDPERFFWIALVIVFSICLHEFCHAWVAMTQGDTTAAEQGHLTLNPLRQMGFTSIFTLLLLGLAWGQVPVNPLRMRRQWSPALVAFAGPAANLVLWLVFLVAGVTTMKMGYGETTACGWVFEASVLNFVLFLLNMLPVPGFDGYTILITIFPRLMHFCTTGLATIFPWMMRSSSEFIKGMFFVMVVLLFINVRYLFWIGMVVTGMVGQLIAYGSIN